MGVEVRWGRTGRETINRIYYMRKNSIFHKRKKGRKKRYKWEMKTSKYLYLYMLWFYIWEASVHQSGKI